ncbi:hypothetical protein [Palleronia caenipelagi]|uniref:Uncharacterized protein n=1 Tax=Palleronia caenipelagi TaxID=2489174 RepID=A0A547Q089_9RHOB|nr:hypothetical protein [Palleronia caenipelagi]TRD19803.1 hypothetical protein FEV53_10175 [Palleronia caenipelagi]
MPRLILIALIAFLGAVVLSGVIRHVSPAARQAGTGLRTLTRAGDPPMQRLSYLLLVALIVYAAIWGGG